MYRRSRRGRLSTRACCWPPQIANFYVELSDPDVMSALCLVHQPLLDEYLSQLASWRILTGT